MNEGAYVLAVVFDDNTQPYVSMMLHTYGVWEFADKLMPHLELTADAADEMAEDLKRMACSVREFARNAR